MKFFILAILLVGCAASAYTKYANGHYIEDVCLRGVTYYTYGGGGIAVALQPNGQPITCQE